MNEQPCGISDLETLYTQNKLDLEDVALVKQLIKILQDERNAWLYNCKQLQKQVSALSKQQADNKSGVIDLS